MSKHLQRILTQFFFAASIILPAIATADFVKTFSTTATPATGLASDNNTQTLTVSTGTTYDNYTCVQIKKVTVVLDFEKNDEGAGTDCITPNQGGSVFNGELSYRLQHPDGTTINLVNAGTYSGNTYGGRVQVTLDDAAGSLPSGTPATGTFRPVAVLSGFNGKTPAGTWTFSAGDNANGDPLCTYAVTINITTESGFRIDAPSVIEGTGAGTTNLDYTVLRSPSTVATTVNYATAGVTATSGTDFTATSGTLNQAISAAADTSSTVSVPITRDATSEANETLTMTLSTNTPAASTRICTAAGTGTINNDDAVSIAINDASLTEGDSGTTNATFTVTLTGTTGAFTVPYTANSGTATSGTDFTATSGSLSFTGTSGETRTITVPVIGETLVELDEAYTVTLGTPSNGITVSDNSGAGTITNNDSSNITINDVSLTEGNSGTTNLNFTVSLSNQIDTAISMSYAASGGTAVSGTDYTATSGTLNIPASTSTGTISVPIIGETVVEANETFNMVLSALSAGGRNASITDTTGVGTITNDDSTTISINSPSLTEGDSGSTNMTFTVTAVGAVQGGFTVNYGTASGTATSGTDFTASSGTLTFVGTVGETQTFTVPILGDTLLEANETFTATLSAISNANVTASTGTGTGTITDNDTATVSIATTTNGNEAGPVSVVHTATLSKVNNTGSAITVSVFSSGTATPVTDYSAFPGTISIANGASTGTLTSAVVNDVLVEGTETVTATISSPSNAAVTIATASASANILDNDTSNAVLSVTTNGDETGPVSIVYTVTLSVVNSSGSAVTFDIASSGGTATSGSDYGAISGTVSIADGATTGTKTVTVINDVLVEGTETVQATISNSSNSAFVITGASATANITDNDTGTAALSATTSGDEAGPVSVVYTVTLSATNNTGSAVTFNIASSGGTATSGTDYVAIAGTISVANGASTGTKSVTVVDDALVEGTETLQATISSPSVPQYTIATASATANILDNDTATASLSATTNGLETLAVSIVYTVTLSATNNTGSAVTVDIASSGGTATSGSDYGAISGTVSIANGSNVGTKIVTVVDDAQ